MDLSVRDGHRASHLVEATVLQELPQISEVLVHVEPEEELAATGIERVRRVVHFFRQKEQMLPVSKWRRYAPLRLHCTIQEKQHRDGLGAFVSPCVARTVLYDHVTALQMNGLGVIKLKPDLTVENYRVVDRVGFVHCGIFLLKVIR